MNASIASTLILIQNNFTLQLIYTVFLGLCIGSFLNVVIYRLPKIMKQDWRNQCQEFLELPIDAATTKFNLVSQRSHCPHCNTLIRWYQNIPIFSYIALRGTSACCKKKISLRYPAIEFITMALSVVILLSFGWTQKSFFTMIATYLLLSMSVIDIDEQLLPDETTYILLWLGLLISTKHIFVTPPDAIFGAVAGYLALYLLAKSYYLITKRDGMGHGDFKLLAALGAFVGWQGIAFVAFIAALLGSIIGVLIIIIKKGNRYTPIPFGPYLALAGWIYIMADDIIRNFYFQWMF